MPGALSLCKNLAQLHFLSSMLSFSTFSKPSKVTSSSEVFSKEKNDEKAMQPTEMEDPDIVLTPGT